MIQLDNVTLRAGDHTLFEHASLMIGQSWRVGITGRNGSGKSSLLALLQNQLEPQQGHCQLPPRLRIAAMAQEVAALSQTAIDYVLDGHPRLRQAEAQLAQANDQGDGHAIALAHQQMEDADAWAAPAHAASLLAGLGFSEPEQHQDVAAFSGGWRMRLNLARTLMADADLLLLDEPTNHLDLDAVLWLQQFLQKFPGTLLMISHDREFLDATVQHILHIEQQRLHHYSGNYSTFERTRAEQLALQQSSYQKQQKQVAHLQQFITRFKAKASKAKQAQSRIKALERLEKIAPAHVADGFHFQIPKPDRLPNPMLNLEQVRLGYGSHTVLDQVSLSIRPESRIGLLGPNGAGKSTLIRFLAGQSDALSGDCLRANHLAIGYFEQQQVDALPQQASPYQLLEARFPDMDETRLRSVLGGFGFQGDDVFSPVERFSGGEKARLGLCLLIQDKPALLLLDEPANHLDLDMREALTLALQDYEGAVVIVSHDRHLLDTTVDEFWLVAHQRVTPWEGDLNDYAQWLQQQRQPRPQDDAHSAHPVDGTSKQDAKAKRQQAAQKREALRPLKKKIAQAEAELGALSDQLDALNQQLSDTRLYEASSKAELTALLAEQGQLKQRQSQQEDTLLSLMEALEQQELAE